MRHARCFPLIKVTRSRGPRKLSIPSSFTVLFFRLTPCNFMAAICRQLAPPRNNHCLSFIRRRETSEIWNLKFAIYKFRFFSRSNELNFSGIAATTRRLVRLSSNASSGQRSGWFRFFLQLYGVIRSSIVPTIFLYLYHNSLLWTLWLLPSKSAFASNLAIRDLSPGSKLGHAVCALPFSRHSCQSQVLPPAFSMPSSQCYFLVLLFRERKRGKKDAEH